MRTITLALQSDSGLSIGELLAGIPHDFGAMFAYFMVGTFLFLIWYGNKESVQDQYRQKKPEAPKAEARQAASSDAAPTFDSPPASPPARPAADRPEAATSGD